MRASLPISEITGFYMEGVESNPVRIVSFNSPKSVSPSYSEFTRDFESLHSSRDGEQLKFLHNYIKDD